MKSLVRRLISSVPLCRAVVGGHWYYRYVEQRRYDPSQFCSCGEGVKICAGVMIRSPERMKIGNGAYIGDDCFISATGGFQIGDYSGLAANTTVLTIDHHADGRTVPFDETRVIKPVVIGDCVWVGSHVAILPGVRIGEGAIIGMGSVVRSDIPPCAIVVGNPARVVDYRDKDRYYALKQNGAVRPVSVRCTHFRIPAEMRQKYPELLKEIGYGDMPEYFECKRWQGE